MCRDCEREEHLEDYYGTPDSDEPIETWGDGEGQTTLTGGDAE